MTCEQDYVWIFKGEVTCKSLLEVIGFIESCFLAVSKEKTRLNFDSRVIKVPRDQGVILEKLEMMVLR